jgi:thymidylate synthase
MSKHLFEQTNHVIAKNADEAYSKTLSALIDQGDKINAGESKSIGSGKTSYEIMNFSIRIENPKQRLIFNNERRINLPAAVARFLWMMAGNDRLADIAFYEPKVSSFSDDGIVVPGSSYGQRILRSRPGLDQLHAVIDRLRKDPTSRRAAISIYHPEDAVRDSKDIPCTFGIFYYIRESKLHSTTLMRSNNSFVLMPYNIFEFSLLSEVVCSEVNSKEYPIELGSLTHMAISMHLYDNDVEKSKKIIDASKAKLPSITVPGIPKNSAPLEQIRRLVVLEAKLRHESAGIKASEIESWIGLGDKSNLDKYWKQYYYLLILYIVKNKARLIKSNSGEMKLTLNILDSVINEPWKSYLPKDYFEPDSVTENPYLMERDTSQIELPDITLRHETQEHRRIQLLAEQYEKESNSVISWREFVQLESVFVGIAARDEISMKEFKVQLQNSRKENEI